MIFTKQLMKVDYANPIKAIKEIVSHIRYMQEQLEYMLMNLDSSNITEIDTDITGINSSTGGVSLSGNSFKLTGKNGERFEAGVFEDGAFRFTLLGKNGEEIINMLNDGRLLIKENADITINGGEW